MYEYRKITACVPDRQKTMNLISPQCTSYLVIFDLIIFKLLFSPIVSDYHRLFKLTMAQTTYQMLFPDTCPKDICNQLASMHKDEGWQSTASSLALTHPHFIALKADDDSIVATSSVSYINDRNTWVGNVYVKNNHRRKGLASRLMNQLHKYVVDKGYVGKHNIFSKIICILSFWN